MTNSSDSYAPGKDSEKPVLILVAAGSSSRMGGIKKEYLSMNGGTVLSSAAHIFLETLPFSVVAVTYPAQDNPADNAKAEQKCRAALFANASGNSAHAQANGADASGDEPDRNAPQFLFVPGGKTRQQSVLNALEAVSGVLSQRGGSPANPLVFIHDGARPFVSRQIILDCKEAAEQFGASVPALQPVDTQKETDSEGFIVRHLVRARLAAVQTPQVFRLQPLLSAHRTAAQKHHECTDDTEIWDTYAADGKTLRPVKIVPGSSENIKITYPSDIPNPSQAAQNHTTVSAQDTKERSMKIRTGLGYDKHLLTEGRRLMLGGVEIPFEKGEAGHSDGDVLLHAITDALLGAAAMGDIGSYFPPSDAKWKDADSRQLLATVWKDIVAAGWQLENLDCVIALEKPKFLPWRDEVRKSIAEVLGVSAEQIFVKAKTGEKTGDVGTGKTVEAFATCLLSRSQLD